MNNNNNDKAPMPDQDMNGLLDLQTQSPFHRRAQSEILSRQLPEEISFNPSLSDENEQGEEDLFSLFINMEKLDEQCPGDTSPDSLTLSGHKPDPVSAPAVPMSDPVQDTFMMENGSSSKETGSLKEETDPLTDPLKDPIRDERKGKGPVAVGPRHRQTQSVDETGNGSGLNKELMDVGLDGLDIGLGSARLMEAGMSAADAKKAMTNARLAGLAISDPKKAKRIWANRQSAARSKERKVKYIGELEKRVDILRNESTTLSAQLEYLQRDTNGLTVENNELRLRVQAMEHQVGLQDSLNEALRAEVQRLKIMTGQVLVPNNSNGTGPANSGLITSTGTNTGLITSTSTNTGLITSTNTGFSNGTSFNTGTPFNNGNGTNTGFNNGTSFNTGTGFNSSTNTGFNNGTGINNASNTGFNADTGTNTSFNTSTGFNNMPFVHISQNPNPNTFFTNPPSSSPVPMNPHQMPNQFHFLDQTQPMQSQAPVQVFGLAQPQAQVISQPQVQVNGNQNGGDHDKFENYFN